MALGKKARAAIVITAIYIIVMTAYRGGLMMNRYAAIETPTHDDMLKVYQASAFAAVTDAIIVWIVGVLLYWAFRWIKRGT